MNPNAVGAAIVARLATIDGLAAEVFPEGGWKGSKDLAYLQLPEVSYSETQGVGHHVLTFRLVVLVPYTDPVRAWARVADYLSVGDDEPRSVFSTVRSDPRLGAVALDTQVERGEPMEFTQIAGTDCLGVGFVLTVLAN